MQVHGVYLIVSACISFIQSVLYAAVFLCFPSGQPPYIPLHQNVAKATMCNIFSAYRHNTLAAATSAFSQWDSSPFFRMEAQASHVHVCKLLVPSNALVLCLGTKCQTRGDTISQHIMFTGALTSNSLVFGDQSIPVEMFKASATLQFLTKREVPIPDLAKTWASEGLYEQLLAAKFQLAVYEKDLKNAQMNADATKAKVAQLTAADAAVNETPEKRQKVS